ncbi:sensor domain-containing diguanylate cyclase [Arabiibacter massiliensis]|uniref:sensor domain-containing diguanylate cyclase n=1 Tax=Arabiibacter massiliensis TaxID=1870985 RepID=UPI0009BAD6BE|nr:diguanylate cyclase [Arabiibacter massiliensis]
MYRKKLSIASLGLEQRALDALAAVEPLDRFEHDLRRIDAFDAEALATCDIAVVDLARLPHASVRDLAPLAARRREERPGRFGALAVVAPQDAVAGWKADDLALVDAVWPSPLEPARAAFELERLLRAAKQEADLRFVRTCLNTAIDSTPELIWFKDARGAHLKVNDAFCATVEKTKEQVEGRGHYYIWDITPDEYAQGEYVCLESEDETMAAGRTCLFDEQVKTKRGMRQFKTYKSPLFDEDGRTMGTVGIAHDVTDLHNIATELEVFINSMPFAIVVLDTDDSIININDKTEEYFAVKRAEVLGGNFDLWRRRVLGDDVVDANDFADDSSFSARIAGVDKVFEINDRAILDVFGNETGHLRIYRDVTVERELERRAIENARTDYLTGLFNRRYFYEYLEERGRDEPLAIVALDLDDFKGINDRFGHDVGDEALLKAGTLLRETFPDDTVIRWGGDEFVVAAFGERSLADLRARSERLLARLVAESQADGAPQAVSGSIGIAVTDDASLSIDELMRRSDEALYRAKRLGKSQCRVHGEEERA